MRDSSEDVIIEYERVLEDPSLKIGCDEEDLFDDDGIIDSQLECATNVPILKVWTNPRRWWKYHLLCPWTG